MCPYQNFEFWIAIQEIQEIQHFQQREIENFLLSAKYDGICAATLFINLNYVFNFILLNNKKRKTIFYLPKLSMLYLLDYVLT